MKPSSKYTTLFLDIGGVFLTNGWDRHSREKAAERFDLDLDDFNSRHSLTFDTYEIGKITLDVYLERTVFFTPRSFGKEEFKQFMFAQSQSNHEMIQFIRGLKSRYSLKTVAVTNEGRELMSHRIVSFELKEWIDFFVCSSFVGLRKPDEEMYRLAMDLAQARAEDIIYIDDRLMLVEIASQLGIKAIQHRNFQETSEFLNKCFIYTS